MAYMSDSGPALICDAAELRRRLDELTLDVRTLDMAGFRVWLERLMARWQTDPVFVQRARIRDLRRAHPDVRRLTTEFRRATEIAATSPAGRRMAVLDKRLHNTEQAITGLDAALQNALPEQRNALAAKHAGFVGARQRIIDEQSALVESSPQQRQLIRIAEEVRLFREEVGLAREESRLAELLTRTGRESGRAGSDFEQQALTLTQQHVLTDLGDGPLHVLRKVRLGAAGIELDLAVVRRRGGVDDPVDVLAVVEVKRNINDLAHGFLRRQIDLTWLTGDAQRYDAAAHRTGHFRTGHFDRPAVHWQDAEPFVFRPDSFRRFVRDPQAEFFLDGLYLLTRIGPVWGLSTAAMSRAAARVSSDEDLDLTRATDLVRLFDWCRSLAGAVETPDVLRQFTSAPERGRQLLVVT
jgi:hypothetical protein